MTSPERFTVLDGGPDGAEREARLAAGADELADEPRGTSLFARDRVLLTIAAALMTTGITIILLGWFGAARSTLVEEQVPYLISGGLLGVALAIVGALTLFAHWLTVLIRQSRDQEAARRRDHTELMAALHTLNSTLAHREEDRANGRARSTRAQRPVRRAPSGS